MSVINFIDIYSPTITLGEIIEKQKVKYYSQEIEYYYNKKLILFLITFYDKKLPKEITLLENNYDKMLNTKLEETFCIENLDIDFINSLCTDICFYTNMNYVKKINEKYPYLFSSNYNYTYFTNTINYVNYNLVNSACSGEKYDIVLYLMEEHNFTIFNIDYLYLENIKPDTLKKILEIEKLENYKHNS